MISAFILKQHHHRIADLVDKILAPGRQPADFRSRRHIVDHGVPLIGIPGLQRVVVRTVGILQRGLERSRSGEDQSVLVDQHQRCVEFLAQPNRRLVGREHLVHRAIGQSSD